MRPYRRRHSPAAQAVQSAIWMIGLGILFLTGDWWPGIMIVVGVSMVAGALTNALWPAVAAMEPPRPPQPLPAREVSPPQPSNIGRVGPAAPVRNPPPAPVAVRLPEICPHCGAPPRSLPNRSDNPNACPYCGTDLS
jgi:hypothetical protein